jgi:hypothetical protein
VDGNLSDSDWNSAYAIGQQVAARLSGRSFSTDLDEHLYLFDQELRRRLEVEARRAGLDPDDAEVWAALREGADDPDAYRAYRAEVPSRRPTWTPTPCMKVAKTVTRKGRSRGARCGASRRPGSRRTGRARSPSGSSEPPGEPHADLTALERGRR